jgi:hypothetical protein
MYFTCKQSHRIHTLNARITSPEFIVYTIVQLEFSIWMGRTSLRTTCWTTGGKRGPRERVTTSLSGKRTFRTYFDAESRVLAY